MLTALNMMLLLASVPQSFGAPAIGAVTAKLGQIERRGMWIVHNEDIRKYDELLADCCQIHRKYHLHVMRQGFFYDMKN